MSEENKGSVEVLFTKDNIRILEHFWVHQEFWYNVDELVQMLHMPKKELEQKLLILQTLQFLESSEQGEWRYNRTSKVGHAFDVFVFQLCSRNADLIAGFEE